MITPRADVAALAAYPLSDPLEEGWVSLAQNESAFAPSRAAIAAGQAALVQTGPYCDPDWTDLRAAIAEIHTVDADAILCGAGSMELIGALIHAFAGPGDRVLGSAFGYLFAQTACAQAGAAYDQAPETDYTVSVDAMIDALRPETRIVFLCNPGNPTGTRIANADILRLREALSTDTLLIIDQAYGEFDDQGPEGLFSLVGRGDTVILRTFSKAYGLAGARVGWGLFPPDIATHTRKLMNPNNISAVSQAMAAAAIRDTQWMQGVVAKTAEARGRLTAHLRAAGYLIPESHTNFVLIPFPNPEAADKADRALRKDGILVRGMGGYGLHHCLRATIGPSHVMDRLADILTEMAGEHP